MKEGICLITAAAMRLNADHRSEMVSQLLFGETFSLIETRGDWLYIEANLDTYRGWVHKSQLELTGEAESKKLRRMKSSVSVSESGVVSIDKKEGVIRVSPGSTLYFLEKGICQFVINGAIYSYSGKFNHTGPRGGKDIAGLAELFLNAPYLWGGRSCFGTDCSGLVQTVFKMAGINLPRDASVQATRGRDIHLLEEAAAGDLAFFDNEDGEITHTGILTGPSEIIHSFGLVRTDDIDHHGIFNRDSKKYTHKLRLIKRIL